MQQLESELDIYPNPFTDHINISLPEIGRGKLHLRLTDELGRMVLQSEYLLDAQTEINWSLPNLATGVYLVHALLLHEGKIERFRRKVLKSY